MDCPGAVQIDIQVSGMTCGACTSAVTDALMHIDGVSNCDVSLVTERAVVQYNGGETGALVAAIEDAGFEAVIIKQSSMSPNSSHEHLLELKIDGMTCGSCSSAVRSAVSSLDTVKSVEVSLTTDTAHIVYTGDSKEFPNLAINAVMDAGFDASILRNTNAQAELKDQRLLSLDLKIFGIQDDDSGNSLRDILSSSDGIEFVELQNDILSVSYNPSQTGVRTIIKCIENVGLSALVAASADNSQQLSALNRVKELQMYYKGTVKTFLLGIPIILLIKFSDYLPSFLTAKISRGLWMDDIIGLALIVPILGGPARPFYRKSYKAIRAKSPTMDVLVTTSVTCAFLYSLLALIAAVISDLQTHQIYLWDACAMILMFVLLGKYLENLARGQTSKALSDLISLVPEQCLVIANDLQPTGELLPTDMLQVNDIVVLHPGERVSADGVVVEGESFISESLITGEARPVRKSEGDKVVGGTINGLGTLKFVVTECGSETKLAQIVSFIKDAQASRAPIQRYADLAAAKFVPAVLGLALTTFLFWLASGLILGTERLPHIFQSHSLFLTCLRLGIAVVVVACPCALGLATPTAVMVGTGVGAKHGILVKGGSTFERGSHTKVVLFDKTGTLTTGNMSVVATTISPNYWPLVRAVESLSEHPVGKALSNYIHKSEFAETKHLSAEGVSVHPGRGIEGTVLHNNVSFKVFVGRDANFMDGSIHAFVDGEDVGSITLKDSLRSDAAAVVEKLHEQGLLVGIVSGDSKLAVDSIAEELGVPHELTWSMMKPENKVEVVQSFRDKNKDVAFVGDGINDSPALVAASVGISLEGATHVAVESSDIVITQKSPIGAVPAALDLCRSTMTRIKRNLFMSVIYNAVMIPFAMGLFLHFHIMLSPMMASAAMALSSVSVVVSSLLLKFWVPKPLEYAYLKPNHWWDWRPHRNYSAIPTV